MATYSAENYSLAQAGAGINSPDTVGVTYTRNVYKPHPGTFSFADADVNLILPWYQSEVIQDSHIIPLKTINMISISQHRDHYPVSGLGNRPIRGVTKGQRLSAGAMSFVAHGESAFSEAMRKYQLWRGFSVTDAIFSTPDELPPMDLLITMINEEGSAMALWIKGLVIVDSSRPLDTVNIQTTETYSFMAAQATNWYAPGI